MLYISFEGIDGSGKTSVLEKVANIVSKNYNGCVCTKEPRGIFRDIILDPENKYDLNEKARFFLYQADRAVHSDILNYWKNTDNIVLCDRGIMSTLVYQGLTTKMDIQEMMDISLIACNNILPNMIILLHASSEIAKKRIDKRNEVKNYFDLKDDDFFKNLQYQYMRASDFLARYYNINILDINTDNRNIDEVSEIIFEEIKKNLTNIK